MKLYTRDHGDNIECAKIAKHLSFLHNEISTIVCETKEEMDEISEYLENDEDCESYVENGPVLELWGTHRCKAGNSDYRVHVYVRDPENDLF